MPDFLQKHFASFVKHSAWAALCLLVLYSFRTDFLLPMMGSLREMVSAMRALERGQDKLLYHTVKGSWRETDPPPPAEIKEAIKPDP